MIVQIYRNLHKSRAAKCPIYSVRNKQTGLVINHVKEIFLCDVKFKVSENGRQKVLKEKRKNVHAFLEGTICNLSYFNGRKIYYNPYKTEFFIDLTTGEKVYNCEYAMVNKEGIFIK